MSLDRFVLCVRKQQRRKRTILNSLTQESFPRILSSTNLFVHLIFMYYCICQTSKSHVFKEFIHNSLVATVSCAMFCKHKHRMNAGLLSFWFFDGALEESVLLRNDAAPMANRIETFRG